MVFRTNNERDYIKTTGSDAIEYKNTLWNDEKSPLYAARLDTASGRLAYNFFNGSVAFANNARYPEEPVSMVNQITHEWKEGTSIHPHIHWLQQAANVPNWLLGYKITKLNETTTLETDYSNYTLLTGTQEFTYTSGVLSQITSFGWIDMTGVEISDFIDVVLFRDTTNVSTLFAGADPSSLTEHVKNFDFHIEIDRPGSREEFIK